MSTTEATNDKNCDHCEQSTMDFSVSIRSWFAGLSLQDRAAAMAVKDDLFFSFLVTMCCNRPQQPSSLKLASQPFGEGGKS